MAEDDFNLDEGSADDVAPAKKGGGGIGKLLPMLLKWVAIALGAVIFIVTVVIVTFNIMNKSGSVEKNQPISAEYTGKREVLSWYSALGSIRTKTSDLLPASVVVEVVLGYKLDDKATSIEIGARTIEIKDFLRQYFSGKTAAELKPQNEDRLKLEIRNAINDNILATTKIKDVKFLILEVIEQ